MNCTKTREEFENHISCNMELVPFKPNPPCKACGCKFLDCNCGNYHIIIMGVEL